jgi:hypothetical protein
MGKERNPMPNDYKDFLCEYPFDGATWGMTIKARSHQEAQERIKQMPWAVVKGEEMMRIPTGPQGFWEWLLGRKF